MIKIYQEEINNTEPMKIDKESLNEVGRLIISNKIDLKMPIVNGATFENMKDSVATIRHDRIIDNKNYSIAGHRYITKGRHFNRLDELEKGDDIQIVTDDGSTIYYKVYDKLVVEPEDPKLPQVGESYFKIEYILGTLLLAVALITRKRI